jgi:hypothetical protein
MTNPWWPAARGLGMVSFSITGTVTWMIPTDRLNFSVLNLLNGFSSSSPSFFIVFNHVAHPPFSAFPLIFLQSATFSTSRCLHVAVMCCNISRSSDVPLRLR